MRFFIICSILLAWFTPFSQPLIIKPNLPFYNNTENVQKPATIRIRCASTISPNENPLIVVDGMLFDLNTLKKINPDDIDTITVLKDATATAFYGCRGINGVIIVTTKKPLLKQFVMKDKLDNSTVSGAISFVPVKKELSSFIIPADQDGIAMTRLLQKGEEYKMIVTAHGYQSYLMTFVSNDSVKVRTLLLEKTPELPLMKLFPNPALQGAAVTIDLKTEIKEAAMLKITDMNGQLLLSRNLQEQERKGNLKLMIANEWQPGTYLVQVTNKTGNTIQSGQLIIQ